MTSEATSIGDELRKLSDRALIAELGLRIAKALDNRDPALLRSCFAPEAVLSIDKVGRFAGIDEILDSLGVLAALDLTQHVITNPLVELAGDKATMESYFIATHIKHDHPGGPIFTVGGAYADELSRVNGEWRVHRRAARMLWSTGNGAMLLKDSS